MSDFTPKSKRLSRLIAVAPEMYEVLKTLHEGPSPIIPAIYDPRYKNFYEAWHKIGNILARVDAEES